MQLTSHLRAPIHLMEWNMRNPFPLPRFSGMPRLHNSQVSSLHELLIIALGKYRRKNSRELCVSNKFSYIILITCFMHKNEHLFLSGVAAKSPSTKAPNELALTIRRLPWELSLVEGRKMARESLIYYANDVDASLSSLRWSKIMCRILRQIHFPYVEGGRKIKADYSSELNSGSLRELF